MLVQAGRDELPHLEEEQWDAEQQAGVERHFEVNEEGLGGSDEDQTRGHWSLQEQEKLLRKAIGHRKAKAYPRQADDKPMAQFIQVIGKWQLIIGPDRLSPDLRHQALCPPRLVRYPVPGFSRAARWWRDEDLCRGSRQPSLSCGNH